MARNIKDLHPRLQEAVAKLKKKFPDIGIGECVRTVAEQDALYAKSIGLGWGGDWNNPVDMPHLYLSDWGKTPSKLKSKYGTPDKFRKPTG